MLATVVSSIIDEKANGPLNNPSNLEFLCLEELSNDIIYFQTDVWVGLTTTFSGTLYYWLCCYVRVKK